jgi:hypothetical protein
VEAEAAQRLVVEQLQSAVMPARPAVDGAELGVTHVASDPTSPTGGDLYDCQLPPGGDSTCASSTSAATASRRRRTR